MTTPHAQGIRVRPGVTRVEVDGETVLFDPQRGLVHHLNVTATRVLDHCDGSSTHEIVRAVAEESGAPLDSVHRDVAQLLEDLAAAELVVPGE